MSTIPMGDLQAPVKPVEPCSLAVVMLIQVSRRPAGTRRPASRRRTPSAKSTTSPVSGEVKRGQVSGVLASSTQLLARRKLREKSQW
jgi:hypothetical protein